MIYQLKAIVNEHPVVGVVNAYTERWSRENRGDPPLFRFVLEVPIPGYLYLTIGRIVLLQRGDSLLLASQGGVPVLPSALHKLPDPCICSVEAGDKLIGECCKEMIIGIEPPDPEFIVVNRLGRRPSVFGQRCHAFLYRPATESGGSAAPLADSDDLVSLSDATLWAQRCSDVSGPLVLFWYAPGREVVTRHFQPISHLEEN